MLVEAYGWHVLGCKQCNQWFNKYKNVDFDVNNEECGYPAKSFEGNELQALLDGDDGQTKEQLAEQFGCAQATVARLLKATVNILMIGRWLPHELTKKQKNRETPLANFCSIGLKKSFCI